MRSFRTTNDVIGVIGHNTQSSPALGPVDLAACISIYSTPGLLRLSDYPLFKKKSQRSQQVNLHTYIPGCVIQLLVLPLWVIRPQHITNGVVFAGEYIMHEAETNPPIVVET